MMTYGLCELTTVLNETDCIWDLWKIRGSLKTNVFLVILKMYLVIWGFLKPQCYITDIVLPHLRQTFKMGKFVHKMHSYGLCVSFWGSSWFTSWTCVGPLIFNPSDSSIMCRTLRGRIYSCGLIWKTWYYIDTTDMGLVLYCQLSYASDLINTVTWPPITCSLTSVTPSERIMH